MSVRYNCPILVQVQRERHRLPQHSKVVGFIMSFTTCIVQPILLYSLAWNWIIPPLPNSKPHASLASLASHDLVADNRQGYGCIL